MADLGEGPGEGPRPLFLDQTEARTLENNFLGLPPLFRGLDDRPPLISRSGSGTALQWYISVVKERMNHA